MSVDSTIRTALGSIVTDVVPNKYFGTAQEYIVYTYDERGDLFGDDTNNLLRFSVSVHYILPHGQNPRTKKASIRAALAALGGTVPECINASDGDTQHYVYEFDLVGDE